MQQPFSKSAIGIMLLVTIMAWLALALQFFIVIKSTATNGLTAWVATRNFFSYFTVLTNLSAGLSLSFVLFAPSSSPGRFFSKATTMGAIAVYIFLVGIVCNTILRFIWEPEGLQRWVDEALHVAVPILYVLCWLLFALKRRLRWDHPFRSLIYPAAYLLYALRRREYSGFYAYQFTNGKNLGYGRVLLNIAGLMVVFIVAGVLFVAMDKKWQPQTDTLS